MKRSLTPVVLGLIIVNVAIHLVTLFISSEAWHSFRDSYLVLQKVDTFGWHQFQKPAGTPDFNLFQTLGSAFAHSDTGQMRLMHILFNMMCLVFFGPVLERHLGSLRFLLLYLFCAIGGGLITAYLDPVANPAVGASGAICGLLIAFAWLFPQARMGLMFLPVQLPSRIFTGLFAAISLALVIYSATTGRSAGGISHFGHLAGMIAGFIFMIGYMILTPRKAEQVTEFEAGPNSQR